MRIKQFGKLACVYLGVGIAWMAFRWMHTPLGQPLFFLGSCMAGASLGSMVYQGKKTAEDGSHENLSGFAALANLRRSRFAGPWLAKAAIVLLGILLAGESTASLFYERHLHPSAANETLASVPTIVVVFGIVVAGMRLFKSRALSIFIVGAVMEFVVVVATMRSRHVPADRWLATMTVGLLLMQLGLILLIGNKTQRVIDSDPPSSSR